MSDSFYLTTPIYYPNAAPHVGTAYTTIICDVIARYKRIMGYDVSFMTGVDEHGQKIQEAAVKNGFTPQQWVDKMSLNFTSLWEKLGISNTDYLRTTQERHINSVKEIIKRVHEKGDIYRGEYVGKYSVSEETFVPENQLVDGKYMGKEVIDVKEASYFFKLSKYEDALLKYIDEHPDFIKPESKKNEVVAFIKQGLQDLSISRTTFDWGIPLEFEEGHVIYVWFDALTVYLTGAGFQQDENEFAKRWTNGRVTHLIGKDILRFHAIIWPAMLMSAGIKLPDTVAAHGWWTVEGEKMSKSLGNVVNPEEEVQKYGLDAFRYYLMREATFGQDADYSKKAMIQRINSDLANDLGNLLNRTIGMQKKYFNSEVVLNEVEESFEVEGRGASDAGYFEGGCEQSGPCRRAFDRERRICPELSAAPRPCRRGHGREDRGPQGASEASEGKGGQASSGGRGGPPDAPGQDRPHRGDGGGEREALRQHHGGADSRGPGGSAWPRCGQARHKNGRARQTVGNPPLHPEAVLRGGRGDGAVRDGSGRLTGPPFVRAAFVHADL